MNSATQQHRRNPSGLLAHRRQLITLRQGKRMTAFSAILRRQQMRSRTGQKLSLAARGWAERSTGYAHLTHAPTVAVCTMRCR